MPQHLTIDLYLDEDDLWPIPALEGGEEVKLDPEEANAERMKLIPWKTKNEGTGLKILTPKHLLTRLSILLAQIRAGKNSYKLKNEIRQILCLLYQHSKITKRIYNNSMK